MERMTAGVDCDNRSYADGIKRMENLLRNNRSPSRRPSSVPLTLAQ